MGIRGLNGVGPLVRQRLVANWRLLAVLGFGILVASTLMAASPVYTRVMNDLGLKTSLTQQLGSASRNAGLRLALPLGSPESVRQEREIAALLSDKLSWLTEDEVRYSEMRNLPLDVSSLREPVNRADIRLQFETASDLEKHAKLVEGRFPQPTNDPQNIEAAVPIAAARLMKLKPGDRLAAGRSFNDCIALPPTMDPAEIQSRARFRCVPAASVSLNATVTVVGFFDRDVPSDRYWSAATINFSEPTSSDTSGPIIPIVMPEQSFYQALPLSLAALPYDFRLTSLADVTRLDSTNIQSTRDTLEDLRGIFQDKGIYPDLALAPPLANFQSRASFNQVPLLILLLQVVGIAIYYVMLVAGLLSERRAEETAMLRSRGASVGQVVALAAMEAAVLAFAVALVAPFIASAAVAALGKTGTFENVSGGHFLSFTVVPVSFLFGLGGAAIAGVAVIVPAFFAARRGMSSYLASSARPGKPFLQRYYIDLGLVALAAFGLWELNQRGSVFDPESVGGWSADPLILVSPLLLIMATGALMFRFLPPLLSVISRLTAATSGPGVTLGFWQMTRSPARYTQLALLVVMAAAVGTFSATYGETTDRSQTDRALFSAGADLRLSQLGKLNTDSDDEVQEALLKVPGVEKAATVYRGALPPGPLPDVNTRIPLIAVNPEETPSLLWFRDDFADESLDGLMSHVIGSPTGGGFVLPGEPRNLAMWVAPTQPRPGMTLWVRAMDARGVFFLFELGQLDYEGYRHLQTPAFSTERDGVKYPLAIVGMLMTQVGSTQDQTGAVIMDDLAVVDGAGVETVVDDFEGAFRWDILRTATRNRDVVRQVGQVAYSGNAAAQYTFRIGATVETRGMVFNDPNIPLPAIASERFLKATGLRPGAEFELVIGRLIMPVTIAGTTRLFPTMDDSAPGFLIINQKHLYHYAGIVGDVTLGRPNEAWLQLTSEPVQRAATLQQIGDDYNIVPAVRIDRQKTLETIRADPVVRASGSGLLLISLLAAFSILALGFGLTLYLGGQARTVEVSVMRAVGLSRQQIFVMIGLEYLFVAALGLIIGTIAGLQISDIMLSFLNVTETGSRVVPPFSLSTRWDTVAIAFAATAVAFVAGVIGLAVYFFRLPVSRVLRLTR